MTTKSDPKKRVLMREVQFEFLAPDAREVYLVGSFNKWNSSETSMQRDKNGIWKKTLFLDSGKYEYRFIVDGEWENDPSCPGCVPNEFGTQNCVRTVSRKE